MTEKFEKIVKINPAYDRRREGYGIHNCTLFMVLKGSKGAVCFSMSTDWYLPETNNWLEECERKRPREKTWQPKGNAVSYHSPIQLHEYELPHENCDWLRCTCYGDYAFSISDTVAEILVREGDEGVWKWLENWYYERFNIEPELEVSDTTEEPQRTEP